MATGKSTAGSRLKGAAKKAAPGSRQAASNARAVSFGKKLSSGKVGPGSGTNIRTGGAG